MANRPLKQSLQNEKNSHSKRKRTINSNETVQYSSEPRIFCWQTNPKHSHAKRERSISTKRNSTVMKPNISYWPRNTRQSVHNSGNMCIFPLCWCKNYYVGSFELQFGWLVGCFGFNGPLRQYFSLYRAISQREGEREEKRIHGSKNVQTTPTRTYYKRSKPLPCCNPNCRTPRHWKFTQHHRTTLSSLDQTEIVGLRTLWNHFTYFPV